MTIRGLGINNPASPILRSSSTDPIFGRGTSNGDYAQTYLSSRLALCGLLLFYGLRVILSVSGLWTFLSVLYLRWEDIEFAYGWLS